MDSLSWQSHLQQQHKTRNDFMLHDCSGAWFEMPLFLTHGSRTKTKFASILRTLSQSILTKLGQREGSHLVAHQRPCCCPSAVKSCFGSDKGEFLGELQSSPPACNLFLLCDCRIGPCLAMILGTRSPKTPKRFCKAWSKEWMSSWCPSTVKTCFKGDRGGDFQVKCNITSMPSAVTHSKKQKHCKHL